MPREKGKRYKWEGASCAYCGKPNVYARGYCHTCYARLLRNGTVEKLKHRKQIELGENSKKILEMYRKGTKQARIADELGVSRQLVSMVIKMNYKPTNADVMRKMNTEAMADWLFASYWQHDFRKPEDIMVWLEEEVDYA